MAGVVSLKGGGGGSMAGSDEVTAMEGAGAGMLK
jgi:hypothetical protein